MNEDHEKPQISTWKLETIFVVVGFFLTGIGTMLSYQSLQRNVFDGQRQLYERLTRVEALVELSCDPHKK